MSREAFEKWYQDKFKRAAIESGYETYLTWQAWQAAQAQTLLEVIRDDSGCPTEVRIAQAGDGEAVGAIDKGVMGWAVLTEAGEALPHGTKLYTAPPAAAANQQLLLEILQRFVGNEMVRDAAPYTCELADEAIAAAKEQK